MGGKNKLLNAWKPDQSWEKQCDVASGFYGRFTLSLILDPPAQPHACLSRFLPVIINRFIYNAIHMYSGITSGRVLSGELLHTKILEVNFLCFCLQTVS